MFKADYLKDEDLVEVNACKNYSKLKKEGKFVKRPKNEKPANQLRVIKASRCHKKAYSNIEQAKSALKSARYAQKKASEASGVTSHREVRYYQCENCGFGSKTAIWHLTSLTVESYTEKLINESDWALAA